jgi:23S rRNA (uracil1939-C5)-methyltransferase
VFELDWCHITMPELMRLWRALRALRRRLPPRLATVVLRLDRNSGRHILFSTAGGEVWGGAGALREALAAQAEPATIWWQSGEGAPRAMAGADQAYPATVFEQVHPAMGERVRAHAVAALGPVAGRRVWDLYAGIGETTAALARAGALVESVESDRRAVLEAERRGPGARRHSARVEEVLDRLLPPALVVANPPRTGMDAAVSSALERLGPERIAYVSCDPATLARDLARLPGYRLTDIRAFDLFPQTAHVETVAVLERAR